MKVLGQFATLVLTWLLLPQAASCGDHHTLRFLHRNTRTPQKVLSMAISPDGKEVSLCVEPGTVHFIRLADGEDVAEIQAQPFAMSYSRDGSRILMIGQSESLFVETRLRGRTPISIPGTAGHSGISVNSHNGKLLIEKVYDGGPAATTGKLFVGDEIIAAAVGQSGPMINALGFAPKEFIARFGGPGNSYLRLQVLHKGNNKPETVTLKRKFLTRKVDGTVEFVSAKAPPIADNVCFFLRNDSLAFVSVHDGKAIGSLVPEDLKLDGVCAVSSDAHHFANFATVKGRARDFGLEIFDLTSFDRTRFVPVKRTGVSSLAFSTDNKELFAANWEFIDVFEVSTGSFLRSYRLDGKVTKTFDAPRPNVDPIDAILKPPPEKAQKMAVSPTLLAAGSAPGDVELVDLATGKSLKSFPLEAKDVNNLDPMVEALQFSPDGRWLVFYVKGVLHIVDVSDLKGDATAP